jgi:hypothetical protein
MFRFSIRDVLWLTVVVGLVAGWWADRIQLREFARQLSDQLDQEKGKAVIFRVGTNEQPLLRGQKAMIFVTEEGSAGIQMI